MQSHIKKINFLLMCLILTLLLCGRVNAATVTWTGIGADSYASTSANWSGNVAPQDGDNVVFDSTNLYCAWDLNVTLASISKTSGYTGEITKQSSATLIIAKVRTWTGLGSDNKASTSANWSGSQVPQSGDKVIFNDTSSDNVSWDLLGTVPALLTVTSGYSGVITLGNVIRVAGNLTVSGGTLNLNDKNLDVDGYLLISAGGTINATSSTITVKGDWGNFGTFIPGTSTVVLAGTNRIIYGDTTFYNLVKIVTTADTLYFKAGSTQTIINNLTLEGTVGNLLSLRSTEPGSYWYINPLGTSNLSFVSISYMYNLSFVNIVPLNSEDAGNNENTNFGGSECVCIEDERILAWRLAENWRVTC